MSIHMEVLHIYRIQQTIKPGRQKSLLTYLCSLPNLDLYNDWAFSLSLLLILYTFHILQLTSIFKFSSLHSMNPFNMTHFFLKLWNLFHCFFYICFCSSFRMHIRQSCWIHSPSLSVFLSYNAFLYLFIEYSGRILRLNVDSITLQLFALCSLALLLISTIKYLIFQISSLYFCYCFVVIVLNFVNVF